MRQGRSARCLEGGVCATCKCKVLRGKWPWKPITVWNPDNWPQATALSCRRHCRDERCGG
ncbi:2Fe-2S iron-sulfur cluster-binding protein [Escherichia coli]